MVPHVCLHGNAFSNVVKRLCLPFLCGGLCTHCCAAEKISRLFSVIHFSSHNAVPESWKYPSVDSMAVYFILRRTVCNWNIFVINFVSRFEMYPLSARFSLEKLQLELLLNKVVD